MLLLRAVRGLLRALLGRPASAGEPLVLDLADARWAVLARVDLAWVSDPGGRTGTLRHRDQRAARRLAWRLLTATLRAALSWRRMSRLYRAAAPRLVQSNAWEPLFRASAEAS